MHQLEPLCASFAFSWSIEYELCAQLARQGESYEHALILCEHILVAVGRPAAPALSV